MEQQHHHQELIQTLLDCVLACENCATACLHEEMVKEMAGCIMLDRDCGDICSQAARLLQRNSAIAHQYLVICEEICRMCAEECGKHDAEHCQLCAEACTRCAEACHAHHEPVTQD
ncbi:four-helix bundle copper-binding protein [Mucilaginibacter sp. RS28]|uniref:Four-helix bundle copper-binding protein n=1 Tax=Mucilaginibacter straminoryzae TaxID=2932774 RepID=A0A9X1X0C3_9SPHI|nr:four-helix bundle copper-binding protein [Mucilaginibacter straminoryzae]MCJ8208296.1 four-helix bundle copper-binding protein [Mucilaginibacter straminoryzae]